MLRISLKWCQSMFISNFDMPSLTVFPSEFASAALSYCSDLRWHAFCVAAASPPDLGEGWSSKLESMQQRVQVLKPAQWTRTISIKQQQFLLQKSPRSTASRYIGSSYIIFEICWDLRNFESNPDVGFLEGIAGIQPASQPLNIQVGSLRIAESKAAKSEVEGFSA
jgi:hypothetical protein